LQFPVAPLPPRRQSKDRASTACLDARALSQRGAGKDYNQ
jgi:hypothetical protein